MTMSQKVFKPGSASARIAADPDLGRVQDPVLARRYGVTRALVHLVRRELGVAATEATWPTPAQARVLAALTPEDAQRSNRQIAQELAVCIQTVGKARRRVGVRQPTLRARILTELQHGPRQVQDLVAAAAVKASNVYQALVVLVRRGLIVRLRRGLYELADRHA